MIGLGLLVAMATAVTLTIMARSRGVSARHIAVLSGLILVIGFTQYNWGMQKTSIAQQQAGNLHGQALWGVVMIISSLLSGVTLGLIGIMRGLTEASKHNRRRKK